MHIMHSRRDFLAGLSAAGAVGALGTQTSLADEPPPETTTIRLGRFFVGICAAPFYLAEAMLRAEGFTDIRLVPKPPLDITARGEADFDIEAAPWLVAQLAAGGQTTMLAGIHPGCFELFAYEPIRTVSDLKGKRFGVPTFGSAPHLLLSVMAAHVGLDPKDIDWIVSPTGYSLEMFANREVDAFLGFPPEPQELRARGLGRAILNMATDPPWSDYFCCIVFGNREFVRAHPIATKRVLRAVLKTTNLCIDQPKLVARQLVEVGLTKRYDYALEALTELPYASWREFDPEDTVRFYALRLHDVGMIESTPQQIIAEGTDWRFLSELKRELKA
jgi:NitT/TauT family transport system substrate-binding protein